MTERLGTTSRLHGRDLHVRLNERVYSELQAFARSSGLALNGCVRLLVERGLTAYDGWPPGADDKDVQAELRALSQSALATLVALEQNLSLLISIVPDGAELVDRSWEEAASAARRRLLRLEQALAEEEAC